MKQKFTWLPLVGLTPIMSKIKPRVISKAEHTELLTELSGAVDAFMADINADSIGDDVVGLTFSEFGRKAKQNGNLEQTMEKLPPCLCLENQCRKFQV